MYSSVFLVYLCIYDFLCTLSLTLVCMPATINKILSMFFYPTRIPAKIVPKILLSSHENSFSVYKHCCLKCCKSSLLYLWRAYLLSLLSLRFIYVLLYHQEVSPTTCAVCYTQLSKRLLDKGKPWKAVYLDIKNKVTRNCMKKQKVKQKRNTKLMCKFKFKLIHLIPRILELKSIIWDYTRISHIFHIYWLFGHCEFLIKYLPFIIQAPGFLC